MKGSFTGDVYSRAGKWAEGIQHWLEKKWEQARVVKKQALENHTVKPAGYWDYLGYAGTVAAALIIIQFASGILLLLHYEPYTERAFSSLVSIRNDVPYGMLFSNLHAVCSKLLLFVVIIHMLRTMLVSAHRGPRALQWYVGAVLLFLMLFSGFSGYLLPWSQQSFWACVVGTESLRVFPLGGSALTSLLRGGPDVSGLTLTRFYWLHITVLPLTILYLTWLHIKLVWKTRVAAPADMHAVVDHRQCIGCGNCEKSCTFDAVRLLDMGKGEVSVFNHDKCNACRTCLEECPEGCITLVSYRGPCTFERIFPDNFLRRAIAVCAVLIVLFGAAYYWYGFSKIPADPLMTPDRIKPEWYFLASYQVLKLLPGETTGLLVLLAATLPVVILPAIDRKGPRNPKKRPVYITVISSGFIAFVILTFWGWLS